MTLLAIPRPTPSVYIPHPSTWHRDINRYVACEKLEDALGAYQSGRNMAAMYLAGYAIECGFQALYCFQNSLLESDKKGSKGHQIHISLGWLNSTTQKAIPIFSHAWNNILEYWGKGGIFDLRYNPNNTSKNDAEIFLCSVVQIHEYLAREIDRLSTPPGSASSVPSRYITRSNQVHVQMRSILNFKILGF